MGNLDNIYFFSKQVQVELNLLENFELKNLRKKDEGWSLQKGF